MCDHIDQFGVGTNCQYLYTEYVNCENLGDDDNGSGGGGDGNSSSDFCTMTTEQAQSGLNSITTSIESDGISSIGQETTPDVNGIIKKPVVVKRHKVKYEFPGRKTATYTLFFPGVIFRTTTSPVWKWSTEPGENLRFQKIAFTEGEIPACLATDVSAVVSLVISADKAKADCQAEVTADLKIWCLGGWTWRTKHDPLDGTYYAYEFQ